VSKKNAAQIAVVLAACICAAVAVAQITVTPAPAPVQIQAATAAAQAVQVAPTLKIDDPAQASEALIAAFNRGSATDVAALFLPEAELTDDAGNVHKGRKEIEALLTAFFQKFPGAKMQQKIKSSRAVAPSLTIQDGEQTIVTKDGKEKTENQMTAVLIRHEGGWAYATLQQNPKDEEQTPHDHLAALSWFIGDWVDEDPNVNLTFSCQWSEDKNFLLVNYESRIRGKTEIKSKQRIGWDPLTEKVHSWIFDSDGGYGESKWTQVDNSWIVKSTAVMPDGTTGSATIVLEQVGPDRFILKGLDRILGDDTLPDFQVPVVRKPPQPAQ
jgi:uncharacterized protein (TIGR02246 family)